MRVQPCGAVYATDQVVPVLSHVARVISDESKSHGDALRRLTGKEFERWLGEVFEAHGLNVHQNVRLLGADIDLFLIESRLGAPPKYIIVECKHFVRSGRAVNLAQVMRLYGLREALTGAIEIKESLLVTSTRFTQPALQFAEAFKMTPLDLQGLEHWLGQFAPAPPGHRLPIVDVVQPDQDGYVRLRQSLLGYLQVGAGDDLELLGMMDHLDLWASKTFRQHLMRPLTDEDLERLASFGI
jgi:hypothetical protein